MLVGEKITVSFLLELNAKNSTTTSKFQCKFEKKKGVEIVLVTDVIIELEKNKRKSD